MAITYIDKGTLITVADGSKVAVEDLKVGDKVQSYLMGTDDFDAAHIGNNEQISAIVAEINSENISGEEINKLSLSNESALSVSGCDLFSPEGNKGILVLPSPVDDLRGGEGEGTDDIIIGDLIYVDSGETLADVSVDNIEDWKNSREMHNICIVGGDTVFANEVLITTNRNLTEAEEKVAEENRLAAAAADVGKLGEDIVEDEVEEEEASE